MMLLFFDVQYFTSTSYRICAIFLVEAPNRWRKNGNFAFVTFSTGFSGIQILIVRILKFQIIHTYTIHRFSKLMFNSYRTRLRDRDCRRIEKNWDSRIRVSIRCQPKRRWMLRGRVEHYKSGIRVSHGGEWPAAGIKMTSGRTHVLPRMAGGIEQRDRRCWESGVSMPNSPSERRVRTLRHRMDAVFAGNSCDFAATGISVHFARRATRACVRVNTRVAVCIRRTGHRPWSGTRPRRVFILQDRTL